jgi:hypothetical protein
VIQAALRVFGSLSEMFRAMTRVGPDGKPHMEGVLNGGAAWLQASSEKWVQKLGKPELSRGMKFFFNAPQDGSACKRMAMFLRWFEKTTSISAYGIG